MADNVLVHSGAVPCETTSKALIGYCPMCSHYDLANDICALPQEQPILIVQARKGGQTRRGAAQQAPPGEGRLAA